jgi:hypothetical protein
VPRVRTMEETLSRSTSAEDFNTQVLSVFGCTALLFGGDRHSPLDLVFVSAAHSGIGIRLAPEAESSRIRNVVVFQRLRLAFAGLVCGLAASLGLTRVIASLLIGVEAWDPTGLFGRYDLVARRGAGGCTGAGDERQSRRSDPRADRRPLNSLSQTGPAPAVSHGAESAWLQ